MSRIDLVRSFRRLRVLVIGDAMLDTYLEGSATRLCTEGPVPVVRRATEERLPGGAANSAVNIRALGGEVDFVGIVGADIPGQILRGVLRDQGVDDRWLVEDEAVATLHKLRILADGQYVVRFDEGDTRQCSGQAHAQLLAHLEEAYARCDLIIISDYRYGVVTSPLLDALSALRAARPRPLIVDSKDLLRFQKAGITIVTPNYLEARLAVDPTTDLNGAIDLTEVERIGQSLLHLIDARHAAITLAERGVLLVERGGAAIHLPAHPVPAAHDVGAGDSFTAALGLAIAAGGTPIEATRIGIDAGSIAVTRRRTAAVNHQELLQRVSLEEHNIPRSVEMLAALLREERLRGRTVVFTNGVFDILHAGHVHFLRRARSLGDLLVVGVNSDASARRLKGKNRPINSEQNRMALVAALDPVDHVISFDEEMPGMLIRALRPHIHVKGGDYAGETLAEADAVREVGGRVVILPLLEQLSTSSVIDRIIALATPEESRVTAEERA